MRLKNNKGFTGVDIAIATVILIVFISLIAAMFYNLSITSKKIQRKTIATNLAIETIEGMKVVNFSDLNEPMTVEKINQLTGKDIKVPAGYTVTTSIDNTTYPDAIKIIKAEVTYTEKNNDEKVEIETLVKNLTAQQVAIKGIYASLNGNTLSFFDNEADARANADSDAHYYGNIQGQGYGAIFDESQGKWNINIPWYKDVSLIKTANIVDEIYPTSTSGWFYDCSNLTQIQNIGNLHTDNDTSMVGMFVKCSSLTSLDVTGFNTSNVTNMMYMFNVCSALTNLDVSKFDTSKVTNMWAMFANCGQLTSLDVTNFDTSKVTSMNAMFYNCTNIITINLGEFDTSNVTDMTAMFADCNKLTSINVSSFNTSKVTSMMQMFYNCNSLTNIDVGNFNTSNVTNMCGMFDRCYNLTTLDLSNFNTEKVTNMAGMFSSCSKLSTLNVTSFNTSNVTTLSSNENSANSWGMFAGCISLKTLDISSFDFSKVTVAYNVFVNMPTKADGAIIKVKDANAQAFVLNKTARPNDWDTTNVIF